MPFTFVIEEFNKGRIALFELNKTFYFLSNNTFYLVLKVKSRPR